jgi:arabinan endo-1,5-alpha-L-arabinosidase
VLFIVVRKQNIPAMKKELMVTTYTNPLTHDDFPDASVIYAENKGYFAYATHDAFSPTINNVLVKHSWDLVHWGESKGALLAPPDWAKNCDKFWCPQVVKVNDEYRMYYAAEPDTKDGMCLAFATSDHPVGFTDCGFPLNQIKGSTYEMIDPCFFIDPMSGKHLLYYGSAREPIRVVELDQSGKRFTSDPIAVLYPAENPFHKLREGAFVTYNPSWQRYFLWVSGDNTWAQKSYAVSVYWSEGPAGNFKKIPGNHLILQPNDHWDSPGHNSVIADDAGNEWMIYHAVDTKDRFIPGTDRCLRKMCMDRILYSNEGWPYVEDASPSFTLREGPALKY